MFKSITYLRYNSSTTQYIYHLVDDDFECEVAAVAAATATAAVASVAAAVALSAAAVAVASAAAAEYHKRGLDVVRNMYLLNIYIQKEWHHGYTFMKVLSLQNSYIDKYHPIDGLSFSKEIYPKVKKLYETLNNFS